MYVLSVTFYNYQNYPTFHILSGYYTSEEANRQRTIAQDTFFPSRITMKAEYTVTSLDINL